MPERSTPKGTETQSDNKISSFLYTRIVRPSKENPLFCVGICLVLLSTLFLSIMLIGGSKAIYLSRFTFDDPIQFITKKQDLTFTLYGYCVDDECSKASMTANFDKMPSTSEITDKVTAVLPPLKKRRLVDIGETTANDALEDAKKKAGNTINDGTHKVTDFGKEAPGLLKSLLNGLDNFQPKHSTVNISGLISLPYLFALILNIIALILLYFRCPISAAFILLASVILNAIALFSDVLIFVWVFQMVAVIPGIGKQHTGPGIHLAAWSLAFLCIAIILLSGGVFYKLCRDGYQSIKKLRKPKVGDGGKEMAMEQVV